MKEGEQLQIIFNEKAILFLYYIEELSIEEISCIEDVSPQKIQKIIDDIKNIFRNKFSYIDFSNAHLMKLIILIGLTRGMQANALSKNQSERIYDNIISEIKKLS